MILAQYPRKQPTATFVRQSRPNQGHARFLAEEENRRNSVFCGQKGHKEFHDALKTIYGPKSSGAATLLSADRSTPLTDKEAILKRWVEHFNSVLNRPSSINGDAINRLPQIQCNVLLQYSCRDALSDRATRKFF